MGYLLGVVSALLLAAAPASASVVLHGHASVYGNDPVIGFVDHGDNNLPALAGATNDRPGIAVMRWDTLGAWWRVCWKFRHECRWVRQTDVGPAVFTGRVVDINATAARVLWRIPAPLFPTDVGIWGIRCYGPRLTHAQMRQARLERRPPARMG